MQSRVLALGIDHQAGIALEEIIIEAGRGREEQESSGLDGMLRKIRESLASCRIGGRGGHDDVSVGDCVLDGLRRGDLGELGVLGRRPVDECLRAARALA